MNAGQATSRLNAGFTLAELLVVVGIIGLIAAVTLPSIATVFGAGADAQAYNVLSAQLSAARAQAIQNGEFTGVHVQLADPTLAGNSNLENTSFCAVMEYKRSQSNFELSEAFESQRLPGTIAFGELTGEFVENSDYKASGFDTDAEVNDFTSFTIVFSSVGAAVKQVEGNDIVFDNSGLFTDLWDHDMAGGASGEPATTAVTMFEYTGFKAADAAGKVAYLNESGQFLPINVYTGQLFPRE
jgi:prepilin-type N-terminal cleavage/methylation domain-containing protein